MSGVKGVVNRSAKTSGKNNSTNTATQNADSKDVVPNKVHEKEKLQPTAEQLRIAKIIDPKADDEIKAKVKQVMQITQKTEDEIVIALHDNSLDVALTIDALLEGPQESWSTTGKKKKNRANSVNKKDKEELKNGEVDGDDWREDTLGATPATTNTAQNNGGFSERRGRGRGGRGGYNSRPRPGDGQKFGEARKWRDRENKENEKNLAEDGATGENRNFRSDSRGSRRGVNGSRYSGRCRGTRMFQNSERGSSGPSAGSNSGFSQPIDTWFNPTAKESKKENWGDTFPSPEDWDNEEYTGSLADTKVFTPSSGTETVVNHESEPSKPNEESYEEVEDWNEAVQATGQQGAVQKTTSPDKRSVPSKTLTPEQSQYLSSLTQESQLKKVTIQPATATFNSHPPVEFVSSPFDENSIGPGKKPTLRARIPPPSKIPLSAVEMPPDDSSANINFLDVSFGAVEISGDSHICDSSVGQDQNSMPVKYDDSVAQKVDTVLGQTDQYSTISNQAGNQNQRPNQVNQVPQPSTKIGPPPGVPPPAADYLSKQNAAANVYQHVNSANSGQPASIYNSVYSNNPQGISSHSSLYGTTTSNINSTNPHIPQLSQSNHSILNANYPQTAAQPPFPSYSYPNPAHSYQASGISYPPIVSAANLASMYTPSTYSNYMHQNLHQTGNNTNNLSKSTATLTSTTNSTAKDSLYEQSQTSSNSLTSSASNNSTGNNISGTASSIGLTQSTLLTSKTTTPTTNKSGVLSGMPPGVAPLVGAQYILSQQGIPGYYHQSHPVMYSDEHLQMVQSRLPHHMTTNFYSPDPMYPTVSSSLTGRENAGAGISNVAGYSSLTDSRFTRTDNNASPVPSTLSQQSGTLAHQQTMLNPPITPSYTYYYGQSVIPANPFQYGTMYPMAPAANANNHGTGASNTMSGYNKTAAAPAAYNNVYETLGSSSVTGGSSTDYGSSSKVGVSGQQSSSQTQGKNNSSDLAAMYSSKSTLNKVNPYDKQQQSFQSPPPFSVNLNNGGVGGHHSGGNYAPVFISPLPPGNPQPHHIAPLHHQIDMRVPNRQGQELSNGTANSMSRNQSVNQTGANKVTVKQPYGQGTTPYWSTN